MLDIKDGTFVKETHLTSNILGNEIKCPQKQQEEPGEPGGILLM